jgi:hypothetical protein
MVAVNKFKLPVSIIPKRDAQTGEWVMPFQAADYVAYEYALHSKRKAGRACPPMRESLKAVARALPIRVSALGTATMRLVRSARRSIGTLSGEERLGVSGRIGLTCLNIAMH